MEYTFQFPLTIQGDGKTIDVAWADAVASLSLDSGEPPMDIKIINEDGDECEQCGTGEDRFFCDPLYWDCECADHKPYIHLKSKGTYCPICKTREEDGMPDSRVNEIADIYDPDLDTAVKDCRWYAMSKAERIKLLCQEFSMDEKEAYEIYDDDPNELPDEIKGYFKQ